MDHLETECLVRQSAVRKPMFRLARLLLRRATLWLTVLAIHDTVHAQPPNIGALRSFLQSPPRLVNFSYEKAFHAGFGGQVPPAQRVQGRWFGRDTYWLQGPAPNAFMGRFGDVSWESHAGDITLYDSRINASPSNHVLFLGGTATSGEIMLLLRLGLMEIDFAEAQWDGPTFSAVATVSPTGTPGSYPVNGALVQDQALQWSISVTDRISNRLRCRTVIHQRGDQPSFVPELIERHQDMGNGIQKLFSLRVFDFAIATTEPQPDAYDPREMREIQARRFFAFYSNDILYASAPGVNPARLDLPVNTHKAKGYSYWLPVFLVVLASGIVITALLAWKNQTR